MSLKLIKEAQVIANLGDAADLYKQAKQVFGESTDASVVKAVKKLNESRKALKENDEFTITPEQILDQVRDHLAPAAGVNPTRMTPLQFNKLAAQFRIELEDHYDETYSNGEWKQLANAAWFQHVDTMRGGPEENEERGWPSDEGRESPENYDDIAPEEGSDSQAYLGSLGADERSALDAEINEPWDDEEGGDAGVGGLAFDGEDEDDFSEEGRRTHNFRETEDFNYDSRSRNRELSQAAGRGTGSGAQSGPYDDDEQKARFAGAMRATDELSRSMGRARRTLHAPRQEENEEVSLEQQGWNDAVAGKKAALQDPVYLKGHGNGSRYGVEKSGQENEETDKSDSLLKSLLTQRKQASQKASEIMKKYELEGAKRFHEIRMKHERSPYDQSKQGEEHAAWTKGWSKAAGEHYGPVEEDPKAKVKAKAKPKAKVRPR